MESTRDLLDALKVKAGIQSDYALAAYLGMTRAQVSNYRRGRESFGDEKAVTVAGLLEKDPGYVLALMQAERAARANNEPMRATWERLAELVKRHGVAAGLLLLAATPSQIGGALLDAGVCILCKIRRALISSLAPARRYGWNAYAVPH